MAVFRLLYLAGALSALAADSPAHDVEAGSGWSAPHAAAAPVVHVVDPPDAGAARLLRRHLPLHTCPLP